MIVEVKNNLTSSLLTVLRNGKSDGVSFRKAAEKLTSILIFRVLSGLPVDLALAVINTFLETDVKADILFVSILRAELLLLATASINKCLNDREYIMLDLGNAGDRFCYTEGVEVVKDYGI
ncbi:hypothetical protein [Desulfurobacterium sp.]